MNVLSLFDGMSCGRIALERAGIKVDKYYASEIDKYAISVSEKNYPSNIQLGDVTKWKEWDIDWVSIDLLIGGSPCQGFSFAGKQLAFDDPRSKLFFVFEDIYHHIKSMNPNVKFLLENVRMKKEHMEVITERLGVTPVMINSSLLSAQNRVRYYWCNWDIEQPEDKGIYLKDILEPEVDDKYRIGGGWLDWWLKNGEFQLKKKYSSLDSDKAITMTARQYASWNGNFVTCVAQRGRNIVDGKRKDYKGAPTEQRLEPRGDGKTNCLTTVQKDNYVAIYNKPRGNNKGGIRYKGLKSPTLTSNSFEYNNYVLISKPERLGHLGNGGQGERVYSAYGKNICLSAQGGGRGAKTGLVLDRYLIIRRLTPIECERLQTVPDNYTAQGVTLPISDNQRYKMLGNGWTVDVIAHILMSIK